VDFVIFEFNLSAFGDVAPPKGSYARDALRTGMEMFHEEGFNPYKFGVIGSSDGHNSSSPVEENKFHGKLPLMDGAASLRMNTALLLPDNQNRATRWGSGGLAAVWAEQNTREALFDAMQNKETYATSGPRIELRFFASYGFSGLDESNLSSEENTTIAYQQVVAIGSDLNGTESQSLDFLVWARKGEDGAKLDRIQIVKLWVDVEGVSHEQVFNVAASNDRKIDDEGNVPPVGNSVNIAEATYSNDIGDSFLQTLWRDPGFKKEQQAAYYARVLEIPTPRWSTFDAKTLGIEPISPTTIQERAISSAIWYQP